MKLFFGMMSRLLVVFLFAGCYSSAETKGGEPGSLTLRLESTSSSGVIYQLRDAVFEVAGPETFLIPPQLPPPPQISIETQSGLYEVFLQDGWQMWHSANGQPFAQIQAELLPPNPISLFVQPQENTTATFVFRVDDGDINFGPGNLVIGFQVEETPLVDPLCEPQEGTCTDEVIGPVVPCCARPEPPVQTAACTGTESVVAPVSCTPTGVTFSYTLTVFQTANSCNLGFDLDGCDGMSCDPGALAPPEGLQGVDNGLSGIASTLVQAGGDLATVNQAIDDSLCGLTDDPDLGECSAVIPGLAITMVVDANAVEDCASVLTSTPDGATFSMMNLGDPTPGGTACLSGPIGAMPLSVLGLPVVLQNAVLRGTISNAGLSDALLGATLSEESAVNIYELALEGGGAVTAQVFDISSTRIQDTSVACDAASSAWQVGGVAQ